MLKEIKIIPVLVIRRVECRETEKKKPAGANVMYPKIGGRGEEIVQRC